MILCCYSVPWGWHLGGKTCSRWQLTCIVFYDLCFIVFYLVHFVGKYIAFINEVCGKLLMNFYFAWTCTSSHDLQLCNQLSFPLSLAIRLHVVQMLYARNVMVLDHVHVCQSIQEILTLAVDQSVFWIRIAIKQEHVCETNVWTHAQALVVSMQSVVWWIMLLRAAVCLAILATLSILAIFLHLVRIFLKLSFF